MFSETMKSYTKNAFFSYASKLLMLGFGFLYTLLIANTLGPARYGLITFFFDFVLGLLNLLGSRIFSDLTLVFVSKYKSFNFLKKVLITEFLLSLTLFLLVNLNSELIIFFLGKGDTRLLFFVSLFLFIQPVYETGIALLQAFKRFGKNFKRLLAEKAIELATAALLILVFPVVGFYGFAGFNLPKGMHAVLLAKAIAMLSAIALIFLFAKNFYFKKTENFLDEIKQYLKGLIPANLLSSFRDQGLVWLMGLFISPVSLGLYYIAKKMLVYSLGSINNALTEVLIPYNVEKSDSKKVLCNYTSLNIKFLIILGIITSFFIVLLGGFFLGLFFPLYKKSAFFLPLLSIYFLTKNLVMLSTIFRAINKTSVLAQASFFSMVLGLISGFFLIKNFGVIGLILTEIVMTASNNFFLFFWLKKHGFAVEIIPRIKDLRFFAEKTWFIVKKVVPFLN